MNENDEFFESHVPVFPPGPKSQATLERLKNVVGNASYSGLFGVTLVRGYNYFIEDEDGNVYLDCLSCAASCILGYAQDFLADAYYQQAKKLQQSCFLYSPNIAAIQLAEKLLSLTPGDFEKRVMIGLSGSDSAGGAIKATRKFTGIEGIIHFKNDYHGSTGISQQASDFGDLNDGIYSKNPNYIELDFPETTDQAAKVLGEIEGRLRKRAAGGIICEPIQGDAGLIMPPMGFMAALRRLTHETNTILIIDEVQSGMGRTGKWWAFEHEGIIPDIFVIAKGLSGGYAPISAVIGRKDVLDSLSSGQHLFTYGGHPPSAAVALAVLNYLESENIPHHVGLIGNYLLEGLKMVQSLFNSIILDVRGRGLMLGIQINTSDDKLAGKIFATRCMELGAYVGFLGVDADVVRIEPPLTIDTIAANFIMSVIKKVASEFKAGNVPDQTIANVKKYSIGL